MIETDKDTEPTINKTNRLFIFQIFLVVVLFLPIASQFEAMTKLSGPYLGQKPPGMTPEIFAPGIISTSNPEICISFSLDAKEVYYTMGGLPHSVILFMKEEGGVWTIPKVAAFSGMYSSECQLSPDGHWMYLCAGIPRSGTGPPKGNWDLFRVERKNGAWGPLQRIGAPLASDNFSADCPSVAANGNIYFYSSNYPEGMGKGDIYVSRLVQGIYQKPENLRTPINTEHYDMDPFIAPDESYLIFSSSRPGGQGDNDLYISFRNHDGTWNDAVNLGNAINSYAHEIHPFVTRDGRYLFFCSKRRISYRHYSESPLNYEEKQRWTTKPGNELEDIYWVDARIIQCFRQNMKRQNPVP